MFIIGSPSNLARPSLHRNYCLPFVFRNISRDFYNLERNIHFWNKKEQKGEDETKRWPEGAKKFSFICELEHGVRKIRYRTDFIYWKMFRESLLAYLTTESSRHDKHISNRTSDEQINNGFIDSESLLLYCKRFLD